MSKDKIKELVKDIHTSLKHFKEKYEKSYEVLQTTQEEGIAKIEETKKGRASKFSSEVDKQIKALRIVIKKEYDKHVELLKKTDETLKYIEDLTNYTKKPDTSVISIQEKLENLIPLLAQIYKDSDYIIGRLRVSTGYTLATQKELVEAGLSYNPVKKLLESEISNIAPGLDMSNTSMGAFNIARGKSTIGSTEGLGGQVATLKERQKQGWKGDTVLDKIRRNKNKEEITNFLTSATPESLSSMPTAMKKKIGGYMGGREIGRLAAIEKGDIHPESSTEKLILEKTGKTREELLSGNFDFPAPAKPIGGGTGGGIGGGAGGGIGGGGGNKGGASSPMEASQKALVAYTGPGQTSGSDFDYLQEYANKLKNEKLQSSSTSSIEKATKKGVQKKTRAKKESGKVVSLGGGAGGTGGTGGGGGGGAGGGGGGTGGARGVVDVRLVDITTSAIKQLDDLLIKVLKQSNITASKTLPASKSTTPKVAPTGGTTPTTSSGAKIVPFNNTTTTPSGLTVIPGGLKQSTTPGGTVGTSFTVGQTVIPGGTTPATSPGAKIIPLNNTATPPPRLTVIPGGLNQSTTPGGTTTTGGTTKQPKLPKDVLDPFRKRLLKIFKEGEEELTFLYAKTDSFVGWIPGFNSAILDARKKGLETLKKGYTEFDKEYASTGSAFKGMRKSIKEMLKISPMTVILAGVTTAFIGLLGAATRLNSKIKEISAELGTSNMQSYEFFKNAMNAQTQYDNMYASLRDVRDVQKGILGDSGILLQVNDKALSSIADNAKNIGVSTEAAGAFTEALRTKGATDVEAANLMAASLELADKSKFIMPQSVMDDIAQNVEFSSKYFSNINKDSKSAQKHLVDTNLQVKALGLNFQKAAKMTQHLLSFEQSIVGEVEASVALGRHVNIGKARELLLQDDIGGAMQQMMDTMGGYEAFQDMDFAKRQLMANAVGLEVSELEKSLYLRDKIGITNEEALNAAMKNSDYLDKVAGKDVELYKVEAKKVLAAEQFNTAVEKVSVAFKSSLLPILEAIVPIVEHVAWVINGIASLVKGIVGFPGKIINKITGKQSNADESSSTSGLEATMNIGMISVMGGLLLKSLQGKLGSKLGEVVGKAKGGFDTLTGTLGTKTNPMYVISLSGGGVGGGVLDSIGGGGMGGRRAGLLKRLSTSKDVLDRAKSIQKIRDAKMSTPKTGAFSKIGQFLSKTKLPSLPKIGGLLAVVGAVGEIASRKSQGQSNTQALGATAAGAGGAFLGAKGGALAGAAMGGAIGSVVPVIGNVVGAAVGGAVGGLAGGAAGYYGGAALVDSQFNKKPSSSYETQPFQYQGMGLNATGSIYGGANKQKATGKPVQTFMADMLPTGFSAAGSIANNSPTIVKGSPVETFMADYTPSIFGTSMSSKYQGSGVVKNSEKSVIQSNSSKNVENQALLSRVLERYNGNDTEKNKSSDEWAKWLKIIAENSGKPSMAVFTPNNARPFLNYINSRNTQ